MNRIQQEITRRDIRTHFKTQVESILPPNMWYHFDEDYKMRVYVFQAKYGNYHCMAYANMMDSHHDQMLHMKDTLLRIKFHVHELEDSLEGDERVVYAALMHGIRPPIGTSVRIVPFGARSHFVPMGVGIRGVREIRLKVIKTRDSEYNVGYDSEAKLMLVSDLRAIDDYPHPHGKSWFRGSI